MSTFKTGDRVVAVSEQTDDYEIGDKGVVTGPRMNGYNVLFGTGEEHYVYPQEIELEDGENGLELGSVVEFDGNIYVVFSDGPGRDGDYMIVKSGDHDEYHYVLGSELAPMRLIKATASQWVKA